MTGSTYCIRFDRFILEPMSFVANDKIEFDFLDVFKASKKHLIADNHNWINRTSTKFLQGKHTHKENNDYLSVDLNTDAYNTV